MIYQSVTLSRDVLRAIHRLASDCNEQRTEPLLTALLFTAAVRGDRVLECERPQRDRAGRCVRFL